MIKIKCPACTVEFEAQEGTQSVICEYCGTRINLTPAAEIKPAFSPAPEEPAPKKKGKGGLIALIIVLLLLLGGGAAAYFLLLKPANEYKAAAALMEEGDYAGAAEAFAAMGDYKDAAEKTDECLLLKAAGELQKDKFSRAAKTLQGVSDKRAADNAVYARFKEKLGAADYDTLGELLEELEDVIRDTDRYEEAAQEEIESLVTAENDTNALGLCYALEGSALEVKETLSESVRAALDSALKSENFGRAMTIYDAYSGLVEDLEDPYNVMRCREIRDIFDNRTVCTPEELEQMYLDLTAMDGYADSEDYLEMLPYFWYDNIFACDDPADCAAAFIGVVSLDREAAEDLVTYVLTETEPLAGIDDDGYLWYADETLIESIYSVLKYYSGDLANIAEEAAAFEALLNYLYSLDKAYLPSFSQLKLLWDIRPAEEMEAFCGTRFPLFLFLIGDWISDDGDAELHMTQDDSGTFHLNYGMARDKSKSGSLTAVNFGLSLYDTGGNEVSRLCDIWIVDFDTIEVYNYADDTDYSMTRE